MHASPDSREAPQLDTFRAGCTTRTILSSYADSHTIISFGLRERPSLSTSLRYLGRRYYKSPCRHFRCFSESTAPVYSRISLRLAVLAAPQTVGAFLLLLR